MPVVSIILVFSIFMVGSYFFEFSSNETLNKPVEKPALNKSLAIMVERHRGEGDYVEQESTTFPTDKDYVASLSGCVDADGKDIPDALTYEGGKATIIADSSAFCFLYFKIR